VQRLVLIAPGLPGWEWSAETRAGWAAEEKAFAAGDFETAADAVLRLWIDGPNRSADDVDPDLRSQVKAMVLRSYERQEGAWEAGADEEDVLSPPAGERLGEVRCPTLVLVGTDDVADMLAIAEHLAASITDARLGSIAGASHLPSLERAEEVNDLLLGFLRDHG
jgi:pimeloyl-ACP methyl ester carboxylesterase